jgi:ketosteroid isomerase-like protein
MAIVLAVVGLTLSAPSVARAQATPEGEIVAAEECTVEPVDVEAALNALAATPELGEASSFDPEATATPPTGEPADEETVAAIEETVRQFFACTNAGDQARVLALLSPELFISASGITADDLPDEESIPELAEAAEAQLGEATPVAEDERTGLVEIRDVVVLDDGRVAATVVGDGPDGESSPALFIFVEQDGVYLIDFFGELAEDGTPAA